MKLHAALPTALLLTSLAGVSAYGDVAPDTNPPGASKGAFPSAPPAKCEAKSVHATDSEIAACEALAKGNPAQRAEAITNLCELLEKRKRYDDALRACNSAIRMSPGKEEPWANRGVLYRSMHRYDRSIADLSKAISLSRQPRFLYLERAESFSTQADHNRLIPKLAHTARSLYDRAIADARRLKAYAQGLSKDKQQLAGAVENLAESTIEQVRGAKATLPSSGNPDDPKRWCEGRDLPKREAPFWSDSYYIEMACSVLIETRQVTGEKLGEAYFHRARAQDAVRIGGEENLGGADAIPDYEKAISLGAQVEEASYSIGAIYVEQGEGDRAIPYLDAAIALNGRRLQQSLATRSQAHGEAGHFEAAMADYGKANLLKPNDPQARLGRSLAYIAQGDYEHALDDCTEAAKVENRFSLAARAHRICGNAYFLMEDYSRALAEYEASAHSSGPSADNFYALAVAKFKLGDLPGAQEDVRSAFFMDPHVAERASKLGIVP